MIAWPAITPTTELEKPGANSTSINRPAVATPRDSTVRGSCAARPRCEGQARL
jgi:hypothetical protein